MEVGHFEVHGLIENMDVPKKAKNEHTTPQEFKKSFDRVALRFQMTHVRETVQFLRRFWTAVSLYQLIWLPIATSTDHFRKIPSALFNTNSSESQLLCDVPHSSSDARDSHAQMSLLQYVVEDRRFVHLHDTSSCHKGAHLRHCHFFFVTRSLELKPMRVRR